MAPNNRKRRTRDPRAVARGHAIRKARDDRKMSQAALAIILGVDRVSVSNWEHGKVGEIERAFRLGLCKTLGFEERELLLDPAGMETDFDVPISREAKSIAYRWDEYPETFRAHLKRQMADYEATMRDTPELAKRLYPDLAEKPPPSRKR